MSVVRVVSGARCGGARASSLLEARFFIGFEDDREVEENVVEGAREGWKVGSVDGGWGLRHLFPLV